MASRAQVLQDVVVTNTGFVFRIHRGIKPLSILSAHNGALALGQENAGRHLVGKERPEL